MAAAVRLRDDFDAARLRALAKASRDPSQLVGQRHDGDVPVNARQKRPQPGSEGIVPRCQMRQGGAGTVNQKGAQVLVPSFADTE